MVPLLIVPQILLSGTIVKFDQLNKKVVSDEYVPFIGDLAASRWAYEALITTQFKDNKFQQYYFNTNKSISNIKYDLLLVIPEIENSLENIREFDINDSVQFKNDIELINRETLSLNKKYPGKNIIQTLKILPEKESWVTIDNYLKNVKTNLTRQINFYIYEKDSITSLLVEEIGGTKEYNQFKNMYDNKSIGNMALNRNTFEPIKKANNKLIRKIEPIYQEPTSNIGKAHFLSSTKKIINYELDTLRYNIFIIWMMSIIIISILVIIINKKDLINK